MSPKTKKKQLYVTEVDGKLYVRVPYRDSAGKRRSKYRLADNERDAAAKISQILAELGQSGPGVFDGERMTFDTLMTEYLKAYPDKPKWYTEPLKDYFKDKRIRAITYGDLKRFKSAREAVKRQARKKNESGEYITVIIGDRKTATINREVEALRTVLLFALRHGWLLRNPFLAGPPLILKSEEDSRDRIPTPEEEARLLTVCVPPRAHLRILVIASLDTGLRTSALHSLTWGCVDFDSLLLRVPRGNRYKGRPKFIGMTKRLEAELLILYAKSNKQPETKIMAKVKDHSRSWRTACQLAGIEGLRFNDLRHGFSTGLMEAGVPKHLAMRAAGHLREEIHDIYTNIDQRIALDLAEALNKLHETRNKKPEYIN